MPVKRRRKARGGKRGPTGPPASKDRHRGKEDSTTDTDSDEQEEAAQDESDAEIEYDFNEMAPKYSNDLFNLLSDYLPGELDGDTVDAVVELCTSSPWTTVMVATDEMEQEQCHGFISLTSMDSAVVTNAGARAIAAQLAERDPQGFFPKLFSSGSVGWILNERLLSSPLLGAQLFVNLFEEYSRRTQAVDFHAYVMVSRVTLEKVPDGLDGAPKKKKKKKGGSSAETPQGGEVSDTSFQLPEEFVCWKHRIPECPFVALPHRKDGSPGEYSLVFAFSRSSLPDILRGVKLLDGYFQQEQQ